MIASPEFFLLLLVGLLAGVLSGVFGIGGGVIIVPALIYILGFPAHKATGTSLAVLLPPIGLAAVLEYYHHDFVDLRAAAIIALACILGAWVGSVFAVRISGPALKMSFGVFVLLTGAYMIYEAWKAG
ncbi:MAG: TSUP family transporter [Acidobacteriota bacterium]